MNRRLSQVALSSALFAVAACSGDDGRSIASFCAQLGELDDFDTEVIGVDLDDSDAVGDSLEEFSVRLTSLARVAPEDVADEVQRVADNYNHLFEQPTLYYAVVLMIATIGAVDELHVACSWAFLGLRVVHSCVQATIDIVPIRFGLFLLAWIVLAVMILRALVGLF